MTGNPYATPTVDVLPTDGSADELIRRAHIKTEVSIKSIGLLNYFGAGIFLLGAFRTSLPTVDTPELLASLLGYFLPPILLIWAGRSIRRLRLPGRVINTILFIGSLFIVPIGTLFGAYALYLLNSQKARTIFSAPYKEIIKNTPHITYKTSKASWIVLLLVILLIIGGIILPLVL